MQLHKHALRLASSLALLVACAGAGHASSGPTGVWIDHTGRGAVEITECNGALCGRIVWLKDAANNSVCGTQVIGNAKPVGGDTWDGGWIYDPEKDAKYSVELKPMGADKLRVMGYMGSKFLSETMTWKRAGADLPRSDRRAEPKAAPAPSVDKAEVSPADGKGEETPSMAKPGEAAPKAPKQAGEPERRAPKSASAPQSCSIEFGGVRITFPCPE
jgi:uncharacterized protein (DUF2147 family)